MIIHVGSSNPVKLQAVCDTLTLYPVLFPNPEIKSITVANDEFGHPKTLKATIEGARDRAKTAFTDCDYSIGLEGGLMKVPHTKSGFMEISVCAIYDGKAFAMGLSPAYEWPKKVTKLIVEGKADGSKAFNLAGYTKHKKLGAMKGGISNVLTNGRFPREEFIKTSLIMALIHLEKPDFYP